MGKKSDSTKLAIVVCDGGSCSDKKSNKLRTRLKEYIEEKSLNIKVKKGDCMKACKEGPVVTIIPGDMVLTKVKPGDAGAVVEKVMENYRGREG
jgi:(2Fe-2S) ferredoxin